VPGRTFEPSPGRRSARDLLRIAVEDAGRPGAPRDPARATSGGERSAGRLEGGTHGGRGGPGPGIACARPRAAA